RSSFDSSGKGAERVCLWQPAFNQARRSKGCFTSRLAPIHEVVRASANMFGMTPQQLGQKGFATAKPFHPLRS
ncbi:hypothetical protein, partial [Sphingopyxis sp.]|uniref:hypothetical protein n=1 Tax=Sphingopyxis sp. TaxID=1908224 RepID=UPI0025EB65B5